MERPQLKLVRAGNRRAGTRAAAALGALVLVTAAAATLLGADGARRPFDPAALAETALSRTLATGDPEPARDAKEALSARLRSIPLDAGARIVVASLAAETAATAEARSAAAEQALSATRLVKSDEWIASGAARVLARCGRADLALVETARMFDYAPGEAAATLVAIEPWVPTDRMEAGIPETPAAWLAWSVRLREEGRDTEADARLAELLARWPGDLPALSIAASAAASRDRLDELRRLVPLSLTLPELANAAPLFAFRARTRAAAGDSAGARTDAARAVRLSRDNPWVLALAGDAVLATDPVIARDYWTRGLYRLVQTNGPHGVSWMRVRLARLDDREGRGRDALREWRAILAERPGDGEAKKRIAELKGE